MDKITPIQYLKQERQKLDQSKIDLHEYGTRLRYIKNYITYQELLELGKKPG